MDRIIELKWRCTSCDTRGILGRHKQCPECGSPRESGEMEMDGLDEDADGDGYNDAPTVTAPELVELAEAGFDWFCVQCGSGNRGDREQCSNCGAPRREPKQESKPRPPIESPPYEETPDDFPPKKTPKREVLLAVGATSLLLMMLYVFFSTTKDVRGEVSAKQWERTVRVDTWTTFTQREWAHRVRTSKEVPPVNGVGGIAGYAPIPDSCVEEFYENERYVCGTEQEDYDCSTYHNETERYTGTCTDTDRYRCGEKCRSTGNGFAKCKPKYCTKTRTYSCPKTRTVRVKDPKTCWRTVPRYCTRPIFKTRCSYLTQEWREGPQFQTKGEGDNLVWATPNVGPLDRIVRGGEYRVKWTYMDGENAKSFSRELPEADYLSWKMGQPVYVRITRVGSVVRKYSPVPLDD